MEENKDSDAEAAQKAEGDLEAPANPQSQERARRPDADRTDPETVPDSFDEADEPLEDARFADEHSISRRHSEPTDVTGTSNDTYLDEPYIDIGDGD